jgi:hypothetical protein
MFETEKAQNESKFAPAWITYFLQAMFPGGSENTERVSYETWAEGLGIRSYGKKKKKAEPPKIDKKAEIAQSQKNLDFIFGFKGTLEKQNLKAEFNKVTRLEG